jgi:hypothetical protein
MPNILLWKGYRFFFYSNEGKPLEGRHIHIRKDKIVAKFWLDPEPSLASCWGMTSNELNGLEYVVRENVALFRSKWDERFSI